MSSYLVPAVLFLMFTASTPANNVLESISQDPVYLSDTLLLDISGQATGELKLGQQATIRTTMYSNLQTDQPFLVIVEVRDSNGVTQYLSWQKGSLKANGNYTTETSWIPERPCWKDMADCTEYVIRSFVISGFENPIVLSTPRELKFIEVIGTAPQVSRVYNLTIDGKRYDVEYSMSFGFIKQIFADANLGSMNVQVGRVLSDTELRITLPNDLVDLFYTNNPNVIGDPAIPVEIYVDTIPEPPLSVHRSQNNITYVIPLQAGAEEIDFAFPRLP